MVLLFLNAGNILILCSISSHKYLQTPTNLFLASLSVNDLLSNLSVPVHFVSWTVFSNSCKHFWEFILTESFAFLSQQRFCDIVILDLWWKFSCQIKKLCLFCDHDFHSIPHSQLCLSSHSYQLWKVEIFIYHNNPIVNKKYAEIIFLIMAETHDGNYL